MPPPKALTMASKRSSRLDPGGRKRDFTKNLGRCNLTYSTDKSSDPNSGNWSDQKSG
ncbi:MAG: hypothetical protein HW398_1136 [Acidobacteria bacterium]|nr:hypothetical protein [Acidobacteriota bacterium]